MKTTARCKCGGELKFSESSFPQYQPSVYQCRCGKEYSIDWVRGYESRDEDAEYGESSAGTLYNYKPYGGR